MWKALQKRVGTSLLLPMAEQSKMHRILEKDRSSERVSPCFQQSLDDSSPGQNIQL